jgi:hypothetical protein
MIAEQGEIARLLPQFFSSKACSMASATADVNGDSVCGGRPGLSRVYLGAGGGA